VLKTFTRPTARLYNRFDELSSLYGIYKVETIADTYLAAGGLMRVDAMVRGGQRALATVELRHSCVHLRRSKQQGMPHARRWLLSCPAKQRKPWHSLSQPLLAELSRLAPQPRESNLRTPPPRLAALQGNQICDGAEVAGHALRSLQFAKAVIRETASLVLPTTSERVRLRIGLHSGGFFGKGSTLACKGATWRDRQCGTNPVRVWAGMRG
jgi:hypothetical protein